MNPSLLALLALAAFAAGFFDAVVGGGGLISMPALVACLPGATPLPVILGINKVQSFTGTSLAAGKFLHSGTVHWREALPPVLGALLGAAGGVALAYYLQDRMGPLLRPLILGLMVAMFLFTLLRPDVGRIHAPRFGQAHQRGLSALIGLALGFYDGFFGPGTGSLLIFLFVAVLGFDFLRASALAKGANWASNLSSVAIFLWRGSWIPTVALAMALANGAGGWLGAHLAIQRGTRLVRAIFLLMVGALILSLGWRTLRGLG